MSSDRNHTHDALGDSSPRLDEDPLDRLKRVEARGITPDPYDEWLKDLNEALTAVQARHGHLFAEPDDNPEED